MGIAAIDEVRRGRTWREPLRADQRTMPSDHRIGMLCMRALQTIGDEQHELGNDGWQHA